ncbi:Ketol-acid reductoisomerase [Venturia nashicola]|uniref:Ketol-acid reductoisomerase n=1 Tax=Venturia nashicola TaxID=86259 RepID=A0A4Z1NMU7_9PEZI|nr:Ketol-acid reductoisomerase [Venturia nashicola]
MAFNDNDDLDLSYMDENPNDTNGQSTLKSEPEDNVDFYDDDFDPNVNPEQNMADPPAADTNNEEVKAEKAEETKPSGENNSANIDQAPQESNGSRKRKERDDDDEFNQNQTPSVSQTPQPSMSTAIQQAPSFGQTATQALDIKQLPIEITEETIREWANSVNVENEIDELKFDEHKQNGKSKGACYVKFKTPAAAQAVKNHITSLPPPPGKSAYTAYYCAQNPYHHRSGKDNYSNNGAGGGGYARGGHQGRGNFGGQGYQARGNFQQRGNFNNNGGYNRGGGFQQGFQGGRGGHQGGYNVQASGFQSGGNFGASFPNNGMMQQNNNFARGGGMNYRGGGRGGMGGAMGVNNMGRGGMAASPMGMLPMAGRGAMPMAGVQNFGMNPMMQAMMQQGGMGMGMPNAGAAGMGRGGFNPMGMMGGMQGRGGFQQQGGAAQGGQMGGHMQKKTRALTLRHLGLIGSVERDGGVLMKRLNHDAGILEWDGGAASVGSDRKPSTLIRYTAFASFNGLANSWKGSRIHHDTVLSNCLQKPEMSSTNLWSSPRNRFGHLSTALRKPAYWTLISPTIRSMMSIIFSQASQKSHVNSVKRLSQFYYSENVFDFGQYVYGYRCLHFQNS